MFLGFEGVVSLRQSPLSSSDKLTIQDTLTGKLRSNALQKKWLLVSDANWI